MRLTRQHWSNPSTSTPARPRSARSCLVGLVLTLLAACGGGDSPVAGVADVAELRGAQTVTKAHASAVLPASAGAIAPRYSVRPLGLGGSTSTAGRSSVNDHGQVAGTAFLPGNTVQHAFFFDGQVVRDLGTLGGATSSAAALNEAGQVAGSAATASGATHAFLYDGSTLRDLGTLGGGTSAATGINALGQVVGSSAICCSPTAPHHAFMHNGTTMLGLGTLGGRGSFGHAINDQGQVVGASRTADVDVHPFLYSAGTLRDLGDLGGQQLNPDPWLYLVNASGQVAGHSYLTTSIYHAVLHDGTTLRDLGTLGGSVSRAEGLNDAGHVVGVSRTAGDAAEHAFFHGGTVMQDLGTLGGQGSIARDISNVDVVVGRAQDAQGQWRAFAWAPGETGLIDLNTRLSDPPTGMVLRDAVAVSNTGFIVALADTGVVLLSPQWGDGTNVAPVVGAVTLSTAAVRVGEAVQATASFTDADAADTHTVRWTWGAAGTSTGTATAGVASGTWTFATAGVHTVTVAVTDSAGHATSATATVAVYDPAAGATMGAGTLVAGTPGTRAVFEFMVSYRDGEALPTGRVAFMQPGTSLRFASTSLDWMVVTGSQVQLQGSGTVDGAPGYRFVLSALDAGSPPREQRDRLRLRIWSTGPSQQEVVIHDNQAGSPLYAAPTQDIAGGEIRIPLTTRGPRTP
jgi:probable HAF family extracellular repeat protein